MLKGQCVSGLCTFDKKNKEKKHALYLMILNEHEEMCPLWIEDAAFFVSSHKWPETQEV